MSTMYDDVSAKCPFFKRSTKTKITCEGLTDRSSLAIEFSSQNQRNIHRETFCNAKYGFCEIHRMLEEKWIEENEE